MTDPTSERTPVFVAVRAAHVDEYGDFNAEMVLGLSLTLDGAKALVLPRDGCAWREAGSRWYFVAEGSPIRGGFYYVTTRPLVLAAQLGDA